MEDPIHSPRSTRMTRRRRTNAGGNITSAKTSAQETKDGPKKTNSAKQRVEAERNPKGAERDQRTTKRS
jgi:hypothetical protein